MSFISALCLILFLAGDQSHLALKRHALSNEIKITALITGLSSGVYKVDDQVIRAMAKVPRHHYIHSPFQQLAYHNVALPVLGQDYMIPEPFITAMMVHLMDISANDKVLDIGFGISYDAAVMAKLAREVYTIQQTEPFSVGKKRRQHKKIKARNVFMHDGAGQRGWADEAPYDAILVRQSMREPPVALLRQLKTGGNLVIPIGEPGSVQRLMVYTRKANGYLHKRATLHVKISPLLKGNQI